MRHQPGLSQGPLARLSTDKGYETSNCSPLRPAVLSRLPCKNPLTVLYEVSSYRASATRHQTSTLQRPIRSLPCERRSSTSHSQSSPRAFHRPLATVGLLISHRDGLWSPPGRSSVPLWSSTIPLRHHWVAHGLSSLVAWCNIA